MDYIKECDSTKLIKDIVKFTNLYNKIFGQRAQPCSGCAGTARDFLMKLMIQVSKQEIK
jgi:hypothetical protein